MSEKRRDNKGRILRNGEVQRSDGKYMFRYTDLNGERKTVYSWRLVATDPLPQGKRDGASLRDMEKSIQKDLDDGIHGYQAERLTLNDLFDKFIVDRTDIRTTTKNGYIGVYENHAKQQIGYIPIKNIRFSHIQKLYLDILTIKGLKSATVMHLHSVLCQLFDVAVRDDLIRKNPARGVLKLVKQTVNMEQGRRHALTEEQQERFIEYVYSTGKYRRWGPLFTVMLGTGIRIGEALGLRWCDCDFEAMVIDINHAIIYKPKGAGRHSGKHVYQIVPPKTDTGIRKIPMFLAVYNALLEMKKVACRYKPEDFVVDGYSGFIFLNSCGHVITPSAVFRALQDIVQDYNKEEQALAKYEKREPCLLPNMSSHILRHTFCTRMCEHEPNIKVVQEVMGHKNIQTTMDIYNEATQKEKVQTFTRIEGKIRLA